MMPRKFKSSSEKKVAHTPSRGTTSMITSPPNTAMLDAVGGRKRAENDLQLLANRIALLRAEEQKATNKVQETKLRAKEIFEIKKRNEDHVQEVMSCQLSKEIAIKHAADRAAMERDDRRRKLDQSKKLVGDNKKALAAETKEQGRKLAEIATQSRLCGEQENKMKAEEERKRKNDLRQLRENERLERELNARREYERKIYEESKRKQEAESLIDMLEREERDLIEKLKSSQIQQQKAYEVLQLSLECRPGDSAGASLGVSSTTAHLASSSSP